MKARFEVCSDGMRALHGGRPLWQLIKELVANSWDEEITQCEVIIDHSPRRIQISVADDGPGFADITDAYTLMAHTPKRSKPTVRGRFNIGEKELLSIAIEGEVETAGWTVLFPAGGGRRKRRNQRKTGTIVRADVRGAEALMQPTLTALKGFLTPPGVTYTVNGQKVLPRRSIATVNATLPTILASGPGEPLRTTSRKTTLNIYNPLNGQGHLYEMGITVQPIDMPYDVDVCQKVPLPPNRDVVSTAYLKDIYAETLNAVAEDLRESDASESWVKAAVEDDRTDDDTVSVVKDLRYGDRSVLWSSDLEANERAYEAGMDIIHPKTLSSIERNRYRDAGLVSSTDQFGGPDGNAPMPEFTDVTPEMEEVADYAHWLARHLLGKDIQVEFVKAKSIAGLGKALAFYGNGALNFNVHWLGTGNKTNYDGVSWWHNAPQPHQTELIIHELSHDAPTTRSHSGGFTEAVSSLSTKAIHLALKGEWWS
jgi:hypothetical protein